MNLTPAIIPSIFLSCFCTTAHAAVVLTTTYNSVLDTGIFFDGGTQFATFTLNRDTNAVTAGGDLQWLGPVGDTDIVITFDDPLAYALGSTTWSSVASGTHLGSSSGGQAVFSLNHSGTATTDNLVWTLDGSPMTNGVTEAYTAGDLLNGTGSRAFTLVDDWQIVSAGNNTSQTLTIGNVGGIVNENYQASFSFVAIPEPSSAILLGLSGLALITRRSRNR